MLTASIDWGDGTTSAGNIVIAGTGNYNVFGTHTYAEEGSDTIKVTITDTNIGVSAQTTSLDKTTDAPLTAQGETLSATQGTPLTNVVLATFTDADPKGTTTDYTAAITWGDGTSGTGTIQVDPAKPSPL